MKNCISLQSSTHASQPLLINQISTVGTRMFIACSNEPSNNWYPHTPGPMCLTRILIMSSHLRARFLSGLFAPSFPAKWVRISHRLIACYMPYLLIHNFITLTLSGKEHKQLTSSFCNFLQPLLFSPRYKLSHDCSVRQCLQISRITYDVSRPYNAIHKIILFLGFHKKRGFTQPRERQHRNHPHKHMGLLQNFNFC